MEFIRPIDTARVIKANDVPRTKALRLYCSVSDTQWQLQVRAPIGIGSMGLTEGKDFMVASASVTRDDLVALRTAIDKALGGEDR